MSKIDRKPVFVALLMAACGGGSADPFTQPSPADAAPAAGGPPAGYVRYTPSSVTVAPGESKLFTQWVAAPFDHDVDVVDIIGLQGTGGHHAVLFSTSDVEDVGTVREWQDADQISSRFIGGVGGEGGKAIKLPQGAVFRVPKGSALFVQTHYINTSDEPLTGTTSLDVKFTDADPNATVASLFTVTSINLDVKPAVETTLKTRCVLKEDMRLLMYTNHMHNFGVKVLTTLTVDDQTTDLKSDPQWRGEWAFNPDFAMRTLADPLVLKAGSTIETTCTWLNDGAQSVGFPAEMCVFLTLYQGDKDIACVDGSWVKY